MATAWTISPVDADFAFEVGELVRITLESGETRVGMVSQVTELPDGAVTLTLWADPASTDDPT